MGFQDVAFLSSRGSFTITCLNTVVGNKPCHTPDKIVLFHKASFLYQWNFMEMIRLSQSCGESDHTRFLEHHRM